MARLTVVHCALRVCCWQTLLWLVAAVAWPSAIWAQPLSAQLLVDLPGGDFNSQMFTGIQRAPGRPNDLFVSRADGNIYRYDLTTNTQSTFLTLPDAEVDAGGGYWGLLGFTFAPDFATSGNVFVHVAGDRPNPAGPGPAANVHHRVYIRKYSLANPLSNTPTLGAPTNLLRWDQPLPDHSGGWMGFQPGDPNTLWITVGDGGNNDANRDTLRTGQNPHDLLSDILRINVSGSGAGQYGNYSIPANNPFADGVNGAPEVWDYAIRSPWGGSFDRQTGDFMFGDVGAFKDTTDPIWTSGNEEVDFERAGSPGGRNYGWRVMEGTFFAPPSGQEPGDLPPNDPSFTPPLYEYLYGGGYGSAGAPDFQGRSVAGGYVYRGPVAELQGKYIFGDWSSHQTWALVIDRDANGGLGGVVPGSLVNLSTALSRPTAGGTSALNGQTAFGEDAAGNLYYVELGGRLFKIIGAVVRTAAGDYNQNGIVDAADYTVWRDSLGQSVAFYTGADGNGDGMVTAADYNIWMANFGHVAPGAGSSSPAVPEPNSALLFALSCCGLFQIVRRRLPRFRRPIRSD